MVRKEAVIIGIVAWVVLIILFTNDKTATEGFTGIGLPWDFYRHAKGEMNYITHNHVGFNISNFILDLTVVAAVVYGLHVFLERNVKKKTNKEKPPYLP